MTDVAHYVSCQLTYCTMPNNTFYNYIDSTYAALGNHLPALAAMVVLR